MIDIAITLKDILAVFGLMSLCGVAFFLALLMKQIFHDKQRDKKRKQTNIINATFKR